MSAGMFLCNATRFKLSFSSHGNVACLQPYAKELEGRWVALVPADDDKHIGMAAERDRLKAANADLAEALEELLEAHPIPSSICKERFAYAHARTALTKHQGAAK